MHQTAEHDVDHAEAAFVIGVLLLQVGKVRRHVLHTCGKELRQSEREVRMLSEHLSRVIDYRDNRRFGSNDVGGCRHVEQQRQLSDARAGLDDRRNRRAVLLDTQRALEEDEQRPAVSPSVRRISPEANERRGNVVARSRNASMRGSVSASTQAATLRRAT